MFLFLKAVDNNKFQSFSKAFLGHLLLGVLCCVSASLFSQQPADGKYMLRYADSTVKETGNYTHGLKDKRWFYYHPNGTIEHKEKWKKGELQWQLFYNHRGKVVKTVDKNGVEHIPSKCNCN